MLNNFIYSKTKELFEEKLASNEVLDEAIVFIEDTREIWNHGTYFGGVSGEQSKDKHIFCNLYGVDPSVYDDVTDTYAYELTENNSQSVFGISISELYNTLVPKVEENVVSDWNLNKIPVVLFTPDGYLLNPTTYAFGDTIGIMYEPSAMLTEGYNRMWQMMIAENSVQIVNMPTPLQRSYITFTIPNSYTFDETLILNESDIRTACELSYNQFKEYGTIYPVKLNVLGHSILESNRYNSNIAFVTSGAGFALITNDENKTITLNSSYDLGYASLGQVNTLQQQINELSEASSEYATKDYIDSQIETAIINALNTEI